MAFTKNHSQKKPNRKTLKAMKRIEKGLELKSFESVALMWKELGFDK